MWREASHTKPGNAGTTARNQRILPNSGNIYPEIVRPHSLRAQSLKPAPSYFKRQSLAVNHRFLSAPHRFVRAAHMTQENSLLNRLQAYYKRYNSGTARWKRHIGQGMEKGPGASTHPPRAPNLQHVPQPGRSPHPVLTGLYGGLSTQPRLIKSLTTGSWFDIQPAFLPGG